MISSDKNQSRIKYSDVEQVFEDSKGLLDTQFYIVPTPNLALRVCSSYKERFISLLCLLIGLISGVLLTSLLFLPSYFSVSQQKVDHASFRTNHVLKTFVKEAIYGDPPSPVTNDAWESLIPRGRGFVQLGLSDEVPYDHLSESPTEGIYCLSVFHQLHRLDMLRHGFYAALDADPEQEAPMQGDHMVHCFDYLRQSLICGADTTLELRDEEHSGVQGWGVDHQCRDYGAIKDWAEAHRSSDNSGIIN